MHKTLLKISLLLIILLTTGSALHAESGKFSTAGFYTVPESGRDVFSMNPAWRFHKGDLVNAQSVSLDDSDWTTVNLPHGIEELPPEASGCVNYQGVVWYRKHFTPADSLKGKKLFLHFEGIMGKSRIYVNGKEEKIHYGGYLPAIIDLTGKLQFGKDNVIAVMADNSNDPSYPPGKPQEALDFTYMGGIYRDCWLIAHDNVFITDPNYENVTAGGGLAINFSDVSEKSARADIKAHIRNDGKKTFSGKITYILTGPDGKELKKQSGRFTVRSGQTANVSVAFPVEKPSLWSPDDPSLYMLTARIEDSHGKTVDALRKRIGIRSVEFRGAEGFWLNGKPFGEPLVGANRHQDFAVVGNAVPNSVHWRDAKKLRDAGFRVIRNAHCPQDPAFMDACDELGLFVIVNTPGWQFWNDSPEFAERVYSDIRNMIRRDRNHPSVWMWEPILNETWYPEDFAKRTVEIVDEEFPNGATVSACDNEARGKEFFKVRFSHPVNASPQESRPEMDPSISYFTREWGDNVDNWNSHNSPSRVARGWGEYPMLVQAVHYASPDYPYTCLQTLHCNPPQHIGGCLWHSFDHQRGYHPDPFYGGVMDAYRQPKYSYEMFRSQRSPEKKDRLYETGPMVFIAHEMTPFSPKDVTVYSNCQEIRLTFCKDGKTMTKTRAGNGEGMRSPILTFQDMYDFMTDKELTRQGHQDDVWLLAEGLIDGKVVASHKVLPARRPAKIVLKLDNENVPLKADGSDFVTVIASITDSQGNVKRLNNQHIRFFVEGEGQLIGDSVMTVNPAPVIWGTAPALVRSTMKPGKIKVTATVMLEGIHTPVRGELEFESVPTDVKAVYSPAEAAKLPATRPIGSNATNDSKDDLKKNAANQLKEVERQQSEFGEKR